MIKACAGSRLAEHALYDCHLQLRAVSNQACTIQQAAAYALATNRADDSALSVLLDEARALVSKIETGILIKIRETVSEQMTAVERISGLHWALGQLAVCLKQLQVLQGALDQRLAAGAPDFPRPPHYYGLDQESVLLSVEDLVADYQRAMSAFFRSERFSGLKALTKAAEAGLRTIVSFDPSRVAANLTLPRENGESSTVYLRLPWSTALLTRYHPNVAHELAHGYLKLVLLDIANAEPRDGLPYHLKVGHKLLCDTVESFLPVHFEVFFEDVPEVMFVEMLADVTAVAVAGPAYLFSAAWALIGSAELDGTTRLGIPFGARLWLLRECTRWLDPEGYWERALAPGLEIIETTLSEYECELSSTSIGQAKLAYVIALRAVFVEIARNWLGESGQFWAVEMPACGRSASEESLRVRRWKFLEGCKVLETDRGILERLDEDQQLVLSDLATRPGMASAPNALWTLHLANLGGAEGLEISDDERTRLRTDPTAQAYLRKRRLPQGRIVRFWRQSALERDVRDGINIKVGNACELHLCRVPWSKMRGPGVATARSAIEYARGALEGAAPGSLVRPILGSYDFLALSPGMRLDRPRQPNVGEHAFFAQTTFIEELSSVELDGYRTWTGVPAADLHRVTHPLAVSNLALSAQASATDALARILIASQSVGAKCKPIAIFHSFAWDSYVVVWQLMEDLPSLRWLHRNVLAVPFELSSHGSGQRVPDVFRSVTQVPLVGTPPSSDVWEADAPRVQIATTFRVETASRIHAVARTLRRMLGAHGIQAEVNELFGVWDIRASGNIMRRMDFDMYIDTISHVVAHEPILSCESCVGFGDLQP